MAQDLTPWVEHLSGLIFLANFIQAAHEVQLVRQSAPHRVVEDDLALHPVPRKKRNPWDVES